MSDECWTAGEADAGLCGLCGAPRQGQEMGRKTNVGRGRRGTTVHLLIN